MEIQYYGANCIKLSGKKFSVVIDDNLETVGLKSITKADDISLRTQRSFPEHKNARFRAEAPGEYEISGAIIHGVPARAHIDEPGQINSVIYTIDSEDVKVAVVGHIHPDLTEDQLEQIGLIDVAIVPVGGNGYTLDGVGALQVIKKLEPKIIIPTHYADKQIKYEVPQQELNEALKGLAMEPVETLPKMKLKGTDIADASHLYILERQ